MEKINYLKKIEPLSPDNLEKIVNLLPAPDEAELTLYDFDSQPIINQLTEIIADSYNVNYVVSKVKLMEPAQEILIDLYKKYSSIKLSEKKNAPRAEIASIKWYLPDSQVSLTPHSIEIKYTGREPNYVFKLRKIAESADILVRVNVGKTK